MLVIADSSALIALINIRCLDILPKLFGEILIPTKVAEELARATRPNAVREFIAHAPAWLSVRRPTAIEEIPNVDAGEREAISLARELAADLLLVDDGEARQAARARSITVTGTVGVLERAARQGLLDLADAFERLKRTDFWIRGALLDERLKLYRQGEGSAEPGA